MRPALEERAFELLNKGPRVTLHYLMEHIRPEDDRKDVARLQVVGE